MFCNVFNLGQSFLDLSALVEMGKYFPGASPVGRIHGKYTHFGQGPKIELKFFLQLP